MHTFASSARLCCKKCTKLNSFVSKMHDRCIAPDIERKILILKFLTSKELQSFYNFVITIYIKVNVAISHVKLCYTYFKRYD